RTSSSGWPATVLAPAAVAPAVPATFAVPVTSPGPGPATAAAADGTATPAPAAPAARVPAPRPAPALGTPAATPRPAPGVPDQLALTAAPARPPGEKAVAVLLPIAAGLLLTAAAMYKHRGLPGGSH
ncbi:hypothetical protein ACWEO5_13110, partial [Kitasatospora sp. NPDC004272]